MADGSPVRVIGHWAKLSEQERGRALSRGLDKILDPGLRTSIAAPVEDPLARMLDSVTPGMKR